MILRMIHRVSSKNLRIGFTVGDGEEFSDETAVGFVSHVLGTSIMFLNAFNDNLYG